MKTKVVAAFTIALLAALALAACGSSDDGSSTSAGGGTSAAEGSTTGGGESADPVVEEAKAAVQKDMEQPAPPDGTPFRAPSGKSVMVVSCGQNADGCKRIAQGAFDGAKALGWSAEIADGRLTPQGFTAGMQRGIDQHVDAIVNASIPDQFVPNAVADVKRAGIVMASAVSGNPPGGNGSTVNADPDAAAQGAQLANWIIADSDGTAKVAILPDVQYALLKTRYEGFKRQLAKCSGCEIVHDEPVAATGDVVTGYRNAMNGVLRQLPRGELDYVMNTSDSEAVGSVQAIRTSGRREVKVVSYDCNDVNLQWIRDGDVQAACSATGLEWGGWAAIDGVARELAGVEVPRAELAGIRLITKDNAPPEGQPAIDVDYQAAFKKIWGR